ncbi:hypothetical protein [Salinibaculum rarum]|uniref:hypothetical protein n=1 Tax=Salinibaculum rarum TaxID=3058903 RepID=UPI00265F9937|nr:hypothetical protein [Salinibaculum sp. KK48]
MSDIIGKIRKAYRSGGLSTVIAKGCPYLYNQSIRPRLPRKQTTYNGIPVRAARWFDSIVPWTMSPERPHYESGLIDALRRYVTTGETVVIVGGGWGVSAVVAAKLVGENGSVIVFEGGATKVEHVRETARLNNVADRITVHHAIVGDKISLNARGGSPRQLPASELPSCDVLELDCEGAEISILEDLSVRPAVINVETHGFLGAPATDVADRLEALSYEVVSKVVAEQDQATLAREHDIYVLTAVDISDR